MRLFSAPFMLSKYLTLNTIDRSHDAREELTLSPRELKRQPNCKHTILTTEAVRIITVIARGLLDSMLRTKHINTFKKTI